MRVIKRDGTLQEFDISKVKRSLLMAFSATGDIIPNVMPLIEQVCWNLNTSTVSVSQIQDCIENVLTNAGFGHVSQIFKKYRQYRDQLRQSRYIPDSSALSEFIFYSKYSRNGETWDQCVSRTLQMHVEKFPQFQSEIEEAFVSVYEQRVLPSMRSLQFGGKAIQVHNARMFNCSFTHVNRPNVFGEILYLLLCGCGVGYSVQWHHIDKLPSIVRINKRDVRHHIIEDTIEGWRAAVDMLIQSFLYGYWVEFGYHKIRGEGRILHTSGGLAPGHLALKESLEAVRELLLKAQGRKLRAIEVHDIICYLACCVMSGGIRRSSLIALFSSNDMEMMYAKTPGLFDPNGLNKQRCQANNSVVIYDDKQIFRRVLELSQYFGEPGFVFLKDPNAGVNPCGEIILEPLGHDFGFCNLTEVDVRASDLEHNVRDAAIIGTLQATYTDFKTNLFNDTARRDALLGVSLTALMDVGMLKAETLTQLKEIVKETNKEWAAKLGINVAKRATCIKPSGTASLLLGCSNGIHPRYSRRYFRRVLIKNEPAAEYFVKQNPHMVEVSETGSRWLVFPVQAPDNSITLRDISAIKQLENVKLVKNTYADHSVSCTITMDVDERERVLDYIWENRQAFTTLALAPKDIEHQYPHAPFESVQTIKQEKYWNMLIASFEPVNWKNYCGQPDIGSACEGMRCDYMVHS